MSRFMEDFQGYLHDLALACATLAISSGGPEVSHQRSPMFPHVPSGPETHTYRSRRVCALADRRKRFATKKALLCDHHKKTNLYI